MAHILITSGPTRQYLDPVRYLTNASSGLMGACLAQAAIELRHDVTVVSGPVDLEYPAAAKVIRVVSTEEMLSSTQAAFEHCDGLIGAAAPCDYRPQLVSPQKIAKTGEPLHLHLVETEDVVATLGQQKGQRWVVGFALETEDVRLRALAKLERKSCDLIVSNEATAMNSAANDVEILDPQGKLVGRFAGPKQAVAEGILAVIQEHLIARSSSLNRPH